MLVVLSPIFVVNTKIIFGYNFVAPLRHLIFSWPFDHVEKGCD